MITSPYNFVPVSDKVVCPPWAECVSHDIPFENNESGCLELHIKAESPIYVRNGVSQGANDSEKNAFSNFKNEFFIPGSSIKGMLRSVLEIMSFGRMGNKVNDHKYSVRDFQNRDIYPKETFSKDVLCGWLQKINGEYFLTECDKPGRIDQETLGSLFLNHFRKANLKTPTNTTGWNANNSYHKSAKYKYDIFPSFLTNRLFNFVRTDNGRDIFESVPHANAQTKHGQIVYTGQPGVNDCTVSNDGKVRCGKHYEFIFFDTRNQAVRVADEVIKNFFFAYYEHDKTNQKEDWKWRKPQLDRGERIPVFFRKKADGSIIDLGLSFLYKITYKQSIREVIDSYQNQKENTKLDLAETIFGYTEDKKALKGRVHIGHAFAQNTAVPFAQPVEAVLSGPKASYYPNYVHQKVNTLGQVTTYTTYNDESTTINGWKRYPVRSDANTIPNDGTANVSTTFIPLQTGVEFKSKINYHNLRKEELGALLSAITFHNTEGLFHSIGMAKPLGYGKISVTVLGIDEAKKIECLKAYEAFMDAQLGHSANIWHQSVQIKELVTMAKGANNTNVDQKLVYMELSNFTQAKGRRQTEPKYALQRFSVINQHTTFVNSLINTQDLVAAKQKYANETLFYASIKDVEILRRITEERAKNDFQIELEAKKSKLISFIKAKQQERKEFEIAEKDRLAREEIEQKRKALQQQMAQQGIDFSTVDFSKNIKAIDDAVSKIIIDYTAKIHGISRNGVDKLTTQYISNEDDIEKTIETIRNLYTKIPQNDRKEDKMKYRLKAWVKWIGEEKANDLYKSLIEF